MVDIVQCFNVYLDLDPGFASTKKAEFSFAFIFSFFKFYLYDFKKRRKLFIKKSVPNHTKYRYLRRPVKYWIFLAESG
jgi:hypothetical protein